MAFSKKLSKKQVVFICLTVLIVGAGVAILALNWPWSKEAPREDAKSNAKTVQYDDLSKDLKQVDTEEPAIEDIVSDFGPEYDTAIDELLKSNVAKWDQAAIDKAHFCLLYADKIGASSQAVGIYYQINGAKGAGINVDTNAAGMSQQDRDAILQKNQATESVITDQEEPDSV